MSVDVSNVQNFEILLLPYRADLTFWVSPKSKQKNQGCVRFTQKSYAITTKNHKSDSVTINIAPEAGVPMRHY